MVKEGGRYLGGGYYSEHCYWGREEKEKATRKRQSIYCVCIIMESQTISGVAYCVCVCMGVMSVIHLFLFLNSILFLCVLLFPTH